MENGQKKSPTFLDEKTGLFSREFFEFTLNREIIRCERNWDPFILVFIEIPRQPDVIATAGQAVRENVRTLDLVALYDDTRIAILFMQTTVRLVPTAIERIFESIENALKTLPDISIGMASFPEDGFSGEDLIATAGKTRKADDLQSLFREWKLIQPKRSSLNSEGTILVVDDDEKNVKLLQSQLESMSYTVLPAYNGDDAMEVIRTSLVDLVLLDVLMPGKNGFDVCRQIKSNKQTRVIPVVLVTALEDSASKIQGIEAGADDFLSKPVNMEELLARSKSLISLKRTNNSLISIENVLFSLANAVEAKDKTTQGHIERVSKLAVALGKKMHLSPEDISALRLGGILHDVGKIGVSEDILNKNGPLDAQEWDIMMKHPEIGFRICTPLSQTLGSALEVIRHHHEKLDGSSYPDGLRNGDVSTVARIMAVVDIYDALVMDRPYRKAMEQSKAFSILQEEVDGGKLDAEIVRVLREMVNG